MRSLDHLIAGLLYVLFRRPNLYKTFEELKITQKRLDFGAFQIKNRGQILTGNPNIQQNIGCPIKENIDFPHSSARLKN